MLYAGGIIMKWTGLNDLREIYLHFFETKQHLRLPSFSLVPKEDKSLLLINSGMAPMKKWFLAEEESPSHRVCTCQKCIRTPDIESVGITARHGTYFEMLGNFSFQNYFKHEAIEWAWEFLTSEEWLAIPAEKLYISVYEQDDDAYDIWTKEVGIPHEHMVRLGKADNFWEHGSGPCGPCSEIYFDRGAEFGCDKPTCSVGCDCDRYMEVWNLVFSEFDSDGNGNYEKLAQPNIDTGMGLERLACVMQGAANLFETDTVLTILRHVEKISGKKYGENNSTDISIRVVTDHIRSTTFMVSDGILPSNEGRGYVLRRLLRRAARHGRMLGIMRPFLEEICDTVIEQNKVAYPELKEHEAYIKKIIGAEEERFAKTIDQGLSRLNDLLEKIDKNTTSEKERILSGIEAFRLNDTFGFPLDLTREIAEEMGVKVDVENFKVELQKQREKARKDRASRDIAGWEADLFSAVEAEPTNFLGYEKMVSEATVVAISDGEELLEGVSTDDGAKENVFVILDKTPFYAESGGQVADTGTLTGNGARLLVHSVKKTGKGFFVHACTLESGVLNVGDTILAEIDIPRRQAIMRNHTSAHMLQRALREVLGEHVHQAGSYVDEKGMRFDFTHFSAVTAEELKKVEELVNTKVFESLPVTVKNLPIEEAKKIGATALFGEKYGDIVRIIDINGWSMEFCGGTHVSNTSQLGSFKITSESSVAAGVRRIESVTGTGVLRLLQEKEHMLEEIATTLKVGNIQDLPVRIIQMVEEMHQINRELQSLQEKAASTQAKDLFATGMEVNDIKLYTTVLANMNADGLRKLCDNVKQEQPLSVAVLCGVEGEKATLAVCCGKDAVARGLKAGVIAKEVATLAGGSGGGKPDFAMAGIKELDKLQIALDAVPSIVEKMLGK